MTTVFEALWAIAERLPRTVRGVATGGGEDGSSYLYVDDLVQLALFEDDTFNGGALLIETGDCAGAVLTVRDSVQATGRVAGDQRIWAQVAGETPAAGDIYLVTTLLYNPVVLLMALREALRSWGMVEKREEIGIGDGSEKTFWRVTDGEIVRVWIVSEDGDEATEYVFWEPLDYGIELVEAPANDTKVEVLLRHPAEQDLVLPATRWTLDDELGAIPVDFLGYLGAYALLRSAVAAPGQDQDAIIKLMNYYLEQAEAARNRSQTRGIRARERFMR
jgi:hypothetical protein